MRMIEPVSTSTAGFLGITERGPTTPQLVTSWPEFQSKYGSYVSESYLPYAVNGFFTNGGQRCYIGRMIGLSDYKERLNAFKEINEISIVYIPNADPDLVKAVITHCEDLKDRFAIIDADKSSDVKDLEPWGKYGITKYAAFYYPWIKILDPITGVNKLVPPGGSVAGIFARTDKERGVHKAPANEVVRGAIDLEFQINNNEQDTLTSRGVNVIRTFPARGILVWGARTLSDNSEWKYVNVRRLLIFIEESIVEGTRWVVFEPNDENLWARTKATITEFLIQCWKDGALMGTKPEEAFFVKCDRSTMTQEDIDNGRLVCIIGVAPMKPAEFVIFRIGQWSDGSDVTE